MSKNAVEFPKGRGLNGGEGLLTAVIATAVNDALGTARGQRADAWRYFASETYKAHLDWLGMPYRLPAVFYEGR